MVEFSILVTSVYLQVPIFTEWSVAGPEVARVIAEFEAGMTSGKGSIPKHHDQSASVHKRFAADTKALVTARNGEYL